MSIKAVVQVADVPNANGRIYPVGVLEKALEDFRKGKKLFVTWGVCGEGVELEKVCGVVVGMELSQGTDGLPAMLAADVELLGEKRFQAQRLVDLDLADFRMAGRGEVETDGSVSHYSLEYVTLTQRGTGA